MVLKISLPILTFLIAFLGGLSNSFTDWSWYESLEQSSLRPPNYIFGIVWPILYTLMAVVSFLQAKLIYKVYIAQLILNGAWSWIFFAHQAILDQHSNDKNLLPNDQLHRYWQYFEEYA